MIEYTQSEREQAARVLQEFYDFNKTLTPQGDSWLQADIAINRNTQEELGKALPVAIACLRSPIASPDVDGKAGGWVRTSERLPTEEDGEWVLVVSMYDGPVVDMNKARYVEEMADTYPYWMPLPALPEVEHEAR